MTKPGYRFRVGTLVRLKHPGRGCAKQTARIELFYSDIKGGVRLDKHLQGFVSWNVENLIAVKKQS